MKNNDSRGDALIRRTALFGIIFVAFVVLPLAVAAFIYTQFWSPPTPVPNLTQSPSEPLVIEDTETRVRITATPTPAPFPDDQNLTKIIEALKQYDPAKMPIAFSYESGPYSFRGGDAEGFEIDIIREFERRWYKGKDGFEFEGIGVDDRMAAAESGDYSFVVGAISRTPSRCNPEDDTHKTICTDTIHAKDKVHVMISQTSQTNKFANQTQFCDFFAGQEIGFLRSTAAPVDTSNLREPKAPKWFDDCTDTVGSIAIKDSRQTVVSAVLNGEIAGYFTDGAILRFYANDFDNEVKVVNFEDATAGISLEEYTFLLPQGHKGLRELMDITLQEMVCDGTFSELASQYDQYWGEEYTEPIFGQSSCDSLQAHDAYPLIKKP